MRLLRGHTNSVRCLAFTADGSLLASGSDDHTVRLWDPRSGEQGFTLVAHSGSVLALAAAPGRRALYSAGDDGALFAWDLEDPHHPTDRTLLSMHRPLVALAASPDGGLVAAGGDRPRSTASSPGLVVLEATTGRLTDIDPLPEPQRPVWSLAFAPQGRTLAVAWNNGQVCLWDAVRDRVEATLPHTVAVRALAFSPDGRLLVTAPGTPALVWELAGRTVRHRFGAIRHAIESLAFSPDGTLLTGCLDSTVRLWDACTGQEKARYDWQVGRIHAVAVAPDGMTAAAGGDNGDVVLWDLDP
jgi:WD40 repeat protein